MIEVGLLGASGRMGRQVEALLKTEYSNRARLKCAPARPLTSSAFADLLTCNAIIDFSSPEAVLAYVRGTLGSGAPKLPPLIVGSTGWSAEQRTELDHYATHGAVLQSANFSLGVLQFLQVLRQASQAFKQLGYRVSIMEAHHIHKKDAPSGTALAIERAIVTGSGSVGEEIPIQSVREGEIIGTHEVIFEGPADRIVFRHEAKDRSLFARGAIEAAVWLGAGNPSRGQVTPGEFLTHAVSGRHGDRRSSQ